MKRTALTHFEQPGDDGETLLAQLLAQPGSPFLDILRQASADLRWCGASCIVDEPIRGARCVAMARTLDRLAAEAHR